MFLSRNKRPVFSRLADFFWPRIGWVRSTRYLMHRIGRLPGSPDAVAVGLAYGSAVSFTPFVGFHFILAGLLAWATRASIVASAIGTAVGNPWTFPFIWVWIHELGRRMGIGGSGHPTTPLDFPGLFSNIMEALLAFDIHFLYETAWPIFAPMLAGGIPTAICAGIITYLMAKRVIVAYRAARRARLSRRSGGGGDLERDE